MAKILKIAIFIRLLLAANKGSATRPLTGDSEISSKQPSSGEAYACTEGYPENAKYCVISNKHFAVLPGLEKAFIKLYDEDKVVIELEQLYSDDDGNPRKWIDLVISHSNEKKKVAEMDRNTFIGISIYSQFYKLHGKWKNTLIDNLLELYIKKAILESPERFHNMIYTKKNEDLGDTEKNEDYRDKQELVLLEKFMKTVLIRAIRALGIPASADGHDLMLYVSEGDCTVDEWLKKRASCLIGDDYNEYSTGFNNVVMERVPTAMECASTTTESKTILLALIGMIRSGRHVISVECRNWFADEDFKHVAELVGTNSNLTGVTELRSDMDLDRVLGGAQSQLNYLEIEFGDDDRLNDSAIRFIKGLNAPEIKATLYYCNASTINGLLNAAESILIKTLKIVVAADYLANEGMMKSIADSRHIENLVLENTYETLEWFLVNRYKALKDKSRTLTAYGIGNLNSNEITADLLNELEIERLDICIVDENDMSDLNQLVERGVITRDGFKYLVFTNLRRDCIPRIIGLWERLKQMELRTWPVIITNFRPTGTENVNYVHAGRCCYELYLNRRE